MSSRLFYTFVIISLVFSLLVSMFLVGGRAESSIYELMKQAAVEKSRIAATSLEQFLGSRATVLKDLAARPSLASSVMGSEYSLANLADSLEEFRLLGRKEALMLFNIRGQLRYRNKVPAGAVNVAEYQWFRDLLAEETEQVIAIIEHNGQERFVIAVPVTYNGLPEGVLLTLLAETPEQFVSDILSSTTAMLELTGDYLNYRSLSRGQDLQLVQQLPVNGTGLTLGYWVDSHALETQKWAAMWDIALSIVISLTAVFALLAILGRRLLLNPYLALQQAQEETQRALEESNLLAQAIEASPVGVIMADARQRGFPISYVNNAFVSLTGYDKHEVYGKNCRFLQGKDTDPQSVARISDGLQKGEKVNVELLNYHRDGSTFWNDLHLSPVYQRDGELAAYVGIQLDVSDRKQNEILLQNARDEAFAANQAKGAFLANMSHEVRTPMNGILGMLSLVMRTELTREQRYRLGVVDRSARSLLTLLNDILDFSKIEAGKLDLEIISFNVHNVLCECVSAMKHVMPEDKHVELVIDVVGVHLSMVRGDPGRLRQILTNLLGNAIKFTNEGTILLRANLEDNNDGHWRLNCAISDTGIGIDEESLKGLFDEFSQGDVSTTRKYGGTGLGLAITRNLCQLMGGDIKVRSQLGEGSCFEFSVLLEKTPGLEQVVPQADITGLRLLVVDDNIVNRQVLRGQLELWGGVVSEAASGERAIELCEQRYNEDPDTLFDVAILDMQMSGMNGKMLGKKLKQDARFEKLKLVMMTSVGSRGDARALADVGFNAYFPKPMFPEDLRVALNVLIEGGEALARAEPLLTSYYLADLQQSEALKEAFIKRYRILLVEDNPVNRQVAKSIIQEYDLEVESAEHGEQAIAMLLQRQTDNPFDLILMDCQMPVMDGYQATSLIRMGKAGSCYSRIPIISMTANAMKGDREKCLEAGMSDYLSKPVDELLLRKMLLRWLQGEKAPEPMAASAPDESPQQLVVWDREQALKRVRGKPERLATLIAIFTEHTTEKLAELKIAVAHGNLKEVKNIAHSIKGSAGNLNGLRLQKVSQELELAAHEVNMDEAQRLFPLLMKEYKAFEAEITASSENSADK